MRLPVIDRYVLREILQTWLAVTAILLLILVTNTIVYMLGKVVEGELSGDAVVPIVLTNVSTYVVSLVPLGLYLGLLLAFGRLYAESEMAALGACGVGFARLYRPVMIVGLLAAALTAVLTLWVSPWAARLEHGIEVRMAARSDLAGIAPGRFNRAADGRVVLFAETRSDSGERLREVFVEATGPDGETHVIRSEAAVERTDPDTGWRFLEFRNGHRYTGTPGSSTFRVVEFERHGVRIPRPSVEAGDAGRDGMTVTQLLEAGSAPAAAELHWRMAMPLACLTLALAAVPLSHTTPRKGRYGKIAVALVLYLAYTNMMVLARDAVARGDVPPALGLWWAHALALALILALLAHRCGWRWSAMVLSRRRGDAA